ncbi:MAG: hypothetical protein GY798_02020 [Hyphomicrobiales bacterium]|nr:hypothetical protein [Hyphomicrobiales bacterium]
MTELSLASIDWLRANIVWFTIVLALSFAAVPALLARRDRDSASRSATLVFPLNMSPWTGVLIGAAIVAWMALSVAWEDFTYWDNGIFFGPLRGDTQYYPPPIWPHGGRFFPLSHQEFAWQSIVDGSGVFYHLVASLQLIIACLAATAVTGAQRNLAILLIIGLVGAPSIAHVFLGLIYPERNTIFLFSIHFVFLLNYLKGGNHWSILIAIAVALPTIFYKETSFIIPAVMGFVLVTAAIGPANLIGGAIGRRRLLIAGVPLMAMSIAFILYYVVGISTIVDTSYATVRSRSIEEIFYNIATQSWGWLLLLSICTRVWVVVRYKRGLDPFWDGMALAALVYALSFVVLQLINTQYMAPVAFIAWIYSVRLAIEVESIFNRQLGHRFFVGALALAAVLQLGPTVNNIQKRKELIHSKASAARFVANYALASDVGTPGRPLYLHPLPGRKFSGGLFGGFVEAKYGTHVVVVVPGGPPDELQPCLGVTPVLCDPDHPIEPGELVIALGPGQANRLSDRPDLRLVFTSEGIGFWRNRQRVSVFVAE